ncbi:MAG: hypothetical protein V7722_02790 [Porticoccus sp.]
MKMTNKLTFTALRAVVFMALMALVSGPVLADKVGAAMTGVQSIGSIGHNSDGDVSACDSTSTVCDHDNDTGWKTILTVDIQTQNHAELAFDMALQCGLVTDTTVRSKGGSKDGSTASGKISVRIKVNQADGTEAYALPGTAVDGVTYCSRVQTLEASFAGLNCTADLETGVVTCEDPEELRLILDTLSANAFNYIITGLPVGTHTVEVQARATAGAAIFGTALGEATGEAFIGMGSLFVDEVQLINGWGFIE